MCVTLITNVSASEVSCNVYLLCDILFYPENNNICKKTTVFQKMEIFVIMTYIH